MNPLVDQLAVAAVVTGAIAFFAMRIFRKRGGGKGCASDCGCSATKVVKPQQ